LVVSFSPTHHILQTYTLLTQQSGLISYSTTTTTKKYHFNIDRDSLAATTRLLDFLPWPIADL